MTDVCAGIVVIIAVLGTGTVAVIAQVRDELRRIAKALEARHDDK